MGRKVFFLYPHSVIRDELLDAVVMNEYEAYVLKNHERALKANEAKAVIHRYVKHSLQRSIEKMDV